MSYVMTVRFNERLRFCEPQPHVTYLMNFPEGKSEKVWDAVIKINFVSKR